MALRANTGGTTRQMAGAIWASFLHVANYENHHVMREVINKLVSIPTR